MDEKVAMAAGTGTHLIAGEPDAVGAEAIEGRIDVVETDREMVQPFTSLFYKAAYGGVWGGRFEQFEAGIAERQPGGFYLFMLDGLLVANGDAERRVEAPGSVDAAHGDTDVVELRGLRDRLAIATFRRIFSDLVARVSFDEFLDLLDQRFDSLPCGCDRTDHRRQPTYICAEALHREDLGLHALCAVTVGFVDDEDVGDLHHSCFQALHLVAHAGDKDNNGYVGERRNLDFGLTGADGLDQDYLAACRLHHGAGVGGRYGETSCGSARCHAAEVDAFIGGEALHANAVAE